MVSPCIYRGWVVLGIATLLFMTQKGIEVSWGTTILCFQQDEDFPQSTLALLGTPLSVFLAFKVSLSNLIYMALFKYGQLSLRQFTALGVSLMVLGLFLTSFADSPQFVAASFGILSGSGTGVLIVCTYIVIALWFPWSHRFHVFSTSVLSAMDPLGITVVNVVVANMCADPSLGWRWAFRLCAAVFGSMGSLLLAVFGNPPIVSSEQQEAMPNEKSPNIQKPPWSVRSKVVIHGIWAIAICCKGFAYFLPMVILPKHLIDLGYKEVDAVKVISVFGTVGAIGQAFASLVGDYVKGYIMVANLVAATMLTVNNIIAAYSTSLTAVYVYCAVSGFFLGPYLAGYYAVNNEIMDGENIYTLFLTMRLSKGVGATVGPYLAGHIRDVTGSYQAVFLSIASCFGMFILATFLLICNKKWRYLKS
ncbi:monocarboxylate transporter 13 isoform X2 [Lingula anatina]|uniref:Monocarboxylate transporter 13 isoform X2 n=2 Tax=Lingula anatina TaxID=7574 RepID=A0A1S3IMW9_LINAN|nr:monocarboxylate transporter 13 isoform X2 [Lingula anatina]|eukprot:XP_013399580.1 monocarboxylate transporter 13 isoform X2 [Lingula anatina]